MKEGRSSATPKAPLTIDSAKEKILAKLNRAGRRGAPRGGLGFTATAPYTTIEALERALLELLQEGRITQIFTRPVPRFFTLDAAPKLERVAERILARAESKPGRLLTLTDLEKALSVVEKPLAEKAAARLVEQALLIRLRYQARDVFTHGESLRNALKNGGDIPAPADDLEPSPAGAAAAQDIASPSANPEPQAPAADLSGSTPAHATPSQAPASGAKSKRGKLPESGTVLDLFNSDPDPSTPAPDFVPDERQPAPDGDQLDSSAIEAAYHHLVSESGVSDVEISQLAVTSKQPLDLLKNYLLEEKDGQRAFLSPGDWSLASEAARDAAVEVGGEPFLLVRFSKSAAGVS